MPTLCPCALRMCCLVRPKEFFRWDPTKDLCLFAQGPLVIQADVSEFLLTLFLAPRCGGHRRILRFKDLEMGVAWITRVSQCNIRSPYKREASNPVKGDVNMPDIKAVRMLTCSFCSNHWRARTTELSVWPDTQQGRSRCQLPGRPPFQPFIKVLTSTGDKKPGHINKPRPKIESGVAVSSPFPCGVFQMKNRQES